MKLSTFKNAQIMHHFNYLLINYDYIKVYESKLYQMCTFPVHSKKNGVITICTALCYREDRK